MIGCRRCTYLCRRYRCTCWPTTWNTAVQYATSPSPDRGCYKGTCALILVRNHSAAHTAARHLPTAPTYALICRRTLRSSFTRASAAESLLRSKPILTSTTSRRVSATTPVCRPEKDSHRQLSATTIHDLAWRVSGVCKKERSTDPSDGLHLPVYLQSQNPLTRKLGTYRGSANNTLSLRNFTQIVNNATDLYQTQSFFRKYVCCILCIRRITLYSCCRYWPR